MGSGSSAQAYQLTTEEAAAVDTALEQAPSLRRRVEAGAYESQKLQEEVAQLQEEVRSLRQPEAAAQADIEEPHLYFTLRDKPAILERTADIAYHGHIKEEEGVDCYVSFPGKYAAGWDALIKEHHGQSVACVFLCSPTDGLGKHHKGPDGDCYCHTIYGQRDFRTFGYLKELPASCSKDEMKIEVEKAKATNTVVVRVDATRETKQEAEQKARKAWEDSGRVASWGCQWFHTWKEQVAQAVKLRQRLKVVFFPGQTGQGIVPFDHLKSDAIDLWDGVGCGGSQKCEIAHLELMRRQEGEAGEAWEYDHVDVSHFLKEEFKVGAKVDACNGKEWCRGTLVGVPSRIPNKPKDSKWTIQSRSSGQLFVTDRIRHADFIQTMLAEVGREHFIGLVKNSLPPDLKTFKDQEFLFPDGTPSLAIRLRIKHIDLLQHVRDLVLSNELESNINKGLVNWQIHVDKTFFCKVFELELQNLSDLTDHQKEKVREIKDLIKDEDVHLSAPAGAGKTFVAAQCALDKLRSNHEGHILFVAPSIALGLYFVRWLAQSPPSRGKLHMLLRRIVLMEHPYQHFLSLHVDGDRLGWTTLPDSKMRFLLTIIDEAHDIFCTDGNRTFLEEKIEAPRQVLFLSSVSQNSFGAVDFPPAKKITMTQVVRSTQRIVAGAAAFQASAAEKDQIGSLCPAGPPLKAFLFESDGQLYENYAEHTVSALFFVMCIYAGLSLHKRLALLVPNPDFLEQFRDALQRHFLTARLAGRNFKLISFTESLRMLPNVKVKQATQADNAEMILLDTVENAKGLESLIVVCIGLDQRVAGQSANQVGRSIIYQAITRAQLQAVIVNQLLRGGWLEFLGVTKFKSDTFNESTAMAETTTAAAEALTKVQLPSKLAIQVSQEDSSRREDARAIQRDPLKPDAVPPSKPMLEEGQDPTTAPEAGDKPGDKLVVEIKDSSVWDADVIDIKEPISQLQFDPRSPTGKAEEEVASLEAEEVREAREAREAQEAADAEEAAECGNDIFRATIHRHLGGVRHILRKNPGAVVRKDAGGRTALHWVASNGHAEICRVLLAAGAEVDARTDKGATPLHFAAIKGRVEVVKLLVEAKASVTVKDNKGQTPLDDARKQGHDEVVKILENAA